MLDLSILLAEREPAMHQGIIGSKTLRQEEESWNTCDLVAR